MKPKTFATARQELLAHLKQAGWDVKTFGVQGPLKTPHATTPDGDFRLWFRPQAVYYTHGNQHNANDGRTLWIDIRTTTPDEVVTIVERERRR